MAHDLKNGCTVHTAYCSNQAMRVSRGLGVMGTSSPDHRAASSPSALSACVSPFKLDDPSRPAARSESRPASPECEEGLGYIEEEDYSYSPTNLDEFTGTEHGWVASPPKTHARPQTAKERSSKPIAGGNALWKRPQSAAPHRRSVHSLNDAHPVVGRTAG